jgi:predicted lipoprotein with Yx(FWY)xxD motif
MRELPAAIALALVLTLAACGTGGERDATAEKPRNAQVGADRSSASGGRAAPPTESGTTVTLDESKYGRVLFGDRDRAIYLFDRETSARSECYGACAEAWPPVMTDGQPRAAGGVRSDLLSTITRRDGSKQVAYNGHPLYYYVHDPRGEVLCQNVNEFGGVWLVVDRGGDAIR